MASRKFVKSMRFASVLALSSTLLTGCNPPMPPEALAALAEATFTCIDGEVKTAFAPEVAEGVDYLGQNLTMNCTGMTMTVTDFSSAQLVASSVASDGPAGSAYATVPYAVETGVFVITSSAGATALLSPKSIQGILDGSISEWADPQIVEDNAGIAPLEGPITLAPVSQAESVEALKVWYQHYTGKTLNTTIDVSKPVSVADYENLPEGSIAFMPGAVFTQLSNIALVTPMAASILVDPTNFPLGAAPDLMSVQSAASQWKPTKSTDAVSVAFNWDAKPVPPAGFDVAPAPYQIIYPVNLRLYGTDNLAARATARYLLRQDSQGSFTLVSGLPVNVRAEALAFVSNGLPEPTPAPATE
ncbi:MAG: hypothetical protein ACKOOD_02780 [Microbacteriaceae bacterium]